MKLVVPGNQPSVTFVGKTRAYQNEAPDRSLLSSWPYSQKVDKRQTLSNEEKKVFINLTPRTNVIRRRFLKS